MANLNMLVAGAAAAVLLNVVGAYAARLAADNKGRLDSVGLGMLADNPIADMLRMHYNDLFWTSVLMGLVGAAVVYLQPSVNKALKENVVNVEKVLA